MLFTKVNLFNSIYLINVLLSSKDNTIIRSLFHPNVWDEHYYISFLYMYCDFLYHLGKQCFNLHENEIKTSASLCKFNLNIPSVEFMDLITVLSIVLNLMVPFTFVFEGYKSAQKHQVDVDVVGEFISNGCSVEIDLTNSTQLYFNNEKDFSIFITKFLGFVYSNTNFNWQVIPIVYTEKK